MTAMTVAALSGINAATRRFSQAADDIASGKPDQVSAIIGLSEARRDFEANLVVLRVAADTIDRLLDIKA